LERLLIWSGLRRGSHGLPRRALDDFLEFSNTESNDKEPAQSSSLETAPLLFDVVERLEGVHAARRFERLGTVHFLRLQVQISQLETHSWSRRPSLMLEDSDSLEASRIFEKLMRHSKFHLDFQPRLRNLTRCRQSFARAKPNFGPAETHHQKIICVISSAQESLSNAGLCESEGFLFGPLPLSSSLPSDRNKQVSLPANMGRLQ
jgi:hypothetical protein